MADEIPNSAPASATPMAASHIEAASPSPPAETVTPPVTETVVPVADAPKADETPKAAEKPAEAPKAETLLGSEKKPEAEVQEPPKAEEKPAEVKETEPQFPTYEPFKLPENVTLDDVKLTEFTKSLAEFELKSKAPHEEVQALGQQLMDRHIGELNSAIERYTESLTQAWDKQKNDWKDSFLKDPEFSNRTDTVVNSAIDAIGVYGGNVKQQQEFRELMESTGVGNHPAMIRLLSNIMLAKAEPKPLAAPTIATPAKANKYERMYGKKN